MSPPVMSPSPAPQLPEPPRPAALVRRNQVLAILAIVIAAAVPVLLAFGIDVCAPLGAVGIELAACGKPAAPAPSPGAPGDAGVAE